MPVRFKIIPDFPAHSVGTDGTVWSRWEKQMLPIGRGSRNSIGTTWKPMKLGRQTDRRTPGRSYVTVRLSKGNGEKTKLFSVHVLVLSTFVGPCPEGMQTRHLDGDPTNNRLSNLCWGTPAENTEDKRVHGHFTNKARWYTHEGQTLLLKDWARLKGVPYLTLWNRLNTGVPFADAISLGRYNRKGITRAKRARP